MIGNQLSRKIADEIPGMSLEAAAETIQGARILKLVVAYDDPRIKPLPVDMAIERLRCRPSEFGPELMPL